MSTRGGFGAVDIFESSESLGAAMGNRTEPADGVGADTAGLDCVVRILILGIPQDRLGKLETERIEVADGSVRSFGIHGAEKVW